VSDNISNVNTIGYSRKEITQVTKISNGVVLGVSSPEVRRAVDSFLVNASRLQTAKLSGAETLNSFQDRLQQFTFGNPNSSFTIGSTLSSFFGRLEDLSNETSSAVKANLVSTAGIDFTNTISSVSLNIQRERYNADQDISNSITELNLILRNLSDINKALRQNSLADGSNNSLLDARDSEILKLQKISAANLDFNEFGQVLVSFKNTEILGLNQRYEIVYNRAGSVDDFVNGATLERIEAIALDENGNRTSKIETLLSASNDDEKINNFGDGKISALIKIRDNDLPNILSQLDEFTFTFAERFNEAHNSGTSFPPPASLTGASSVKLSDAFYFDGKFRITLLDVNGEPLTNRYGDPMIPLTIDMNEFNGTGDGKGIASVQSIIDEINNYYGTQFNQTINIGPARDIKIAGVSENITSVKASGNIAFASNPLNGENILINGVTITFVSSSPSGNQVLIGANLGETMNNLTDFLSNSANSSIQAGEYSNSNNQLNIKARLSGVTGNGITISAGTATGATASGANLSGGANASGDFTFDFDFSNLATDGKDIKFDVSSISINGGAASAVTFNEFTQKAGERTRTDRNGVNDDSLTISLTGLGLEQDETFTISATIKVTDGNGVEYDEVVTFQLRVPDPETGSTLNKRFAAISVSGTGDGSVINATSNNPFLNASIVNANGDEINRNDIDGFFRLQTANDTIRFSIDQLDSKERGVFGAADPASTATNYGMSHFFGMNNFFSFGGKQENSSLNIKVRDDISKTPSLIASGKAVRSSQNGLNAVYTYELGAGNGDALRDIVKIQDENLVFESAGTLPRLRTTIGSYASEIYSFAGVLANKAESDFEKEQLLDSTIQQKLGAVSGVNLDQEIASTIRYQTAYSASARVVSIIRELFQSLESALTT
ncbi:MAG: flagellar basal body rod C-terminal domain-containing protein, partial [Rickettsiales bacterium]|nr:flagellar basal body rod C-terminal domain-containing protein [Rickettsiales bacterium]